MSNDTMYFNSSRRLPTHSRNNSPIVAAKNNSSTRIPALNNKKPSKKTEKDIEQLLSPQQLPNGQRPDFGHGPRGGKQTNGAKTKNKKKQDKELQETKDSYDNLTKNLKNLLINPEKTEKTVVETLIKSNSNSATATPQKAPNTTQGITNSHGLSQNFSSPLSTPMILPHNLPMNPLGNPNFPANNHYLPYNPQQLQQQQQQQNRLPVGPGPMNFDNFRPGIAPVAPPQPPPGYPPGPNGPPPGMPQQLNFNGQPMYYNQPPMPIPNSAFPINQSIGASPTLPRIIPPNPMNYINPALSTPPVVKNPTSNGPVTNTKPTNKSKRNSGRKSNTFAGASFATDVPNESNLPKPSFT
ncbi:Hypothetical protein J6896_02829 [Nakaseomyces glabratus]